MVFIMYSIFIPKSQPVSGDFVVFYMYLCYKVILIKLFKRRCEHTTQLIPLIN